MEFKAVSQAQRAFVFDDAHRITVALGGQRSGKTHCGVVKCLRHVLDYPGARILWTAPDMDRLEAGLISKFMQLAPPELILEHLISRKKIILANGSEIRWRSTDVPGGLRAGEQSFAVFDEAAWSPYLQEKRTYADLRGRLNLHQREFWCDNYWIPDFPKGNTDVEILESGSSQSLIRVTYHPQLVITTTPKMGSFTNELLEVPPSNVTLYHFHTEDNADNLAPGYIEELQEAYAGNLLRQEAYGELISVDSPDYPTFDPKVHVHSGPVEYSLVIGGIDWGYRASFALVVIGFTSNGVAFGVEEWGEPHLELDRIVLKASELMQKHNIHTYFCDQAEPANIAFLNRHGVSAVKQSVIQKMYRTSAVASRFQRNDLGTYRLYLDPSMRQTIRQLRFAGESIEDPSKLKEIKSGRPGHDFVDALEYAITGGERMLGSPFYPTSARGQKRDEGFGVPISQPFRFIG